MSRLRTAQGELWVNDTAVSENIVSWLRLLGTLAVLGALVLTAGCASAPARFPSATAQAHIGKSLFSLEMRWSTPARLHEVHGKHIATWRFNQYNYAGCNVTVHTDRSDVIREVTWTQGCGPKSRHKRPVKPPATKSPAAAG